MPKVKPAPSRLDKLVRVLPESLALSLKIFFAGLEGNLALRHGENRKILRDYEVLLIHYLESGVSGEEILRRLKLALLPQGFYNLRRQDTWYELDCAAKVYPLMISTNSMAVFRLSATLKKPVSPAVLQVALLSVMPRFPRFAASLKRGVFWHYLNGTAKRFEAAAESAPPCSPISLKKINSECFRVLYYKNRISVEFFHILTDGSGGMFFLKALLARYLALTGDAPGDFEAAGISALPKPSEERDMFLQAKDAEGAGGFRQSRALQLGGRHSKHPQIIHFEFLSGDLLAAARARGVTITALFTAAMVFAAHRTIKKPPKPDACFNIQVPANMRKFFNSDTLMNFSMYCTVSVPYLQSGNFESLLDECQSQIIQKTDVQPLGRMMSAAKKLARHRLLRPTPLPLKRLAMKLINFFVGENVQSTTLSNLGRTELWPGAEEHVDKIGFVLAPPALNRAACTLVSFGGKTEFTVSKSCETDGFERALHDIFKSLDLKFSTGGSRGKNET